MTIWANFHLSHTLKHSKILEKNTCPQENRVEVKFDHAKGKWPAPRECQDLISIKLQMVPKNCKIVVPLISFSCYQWTVNKHLPVLAHLHVACNRIREVSRGGRVWFHCPNSTLLSGFSGKEHQTSVELFHAKIQMTQNYQFL